MTVHKVRLTSQSIIRGQRCSPLSAAEFETYVGFVDFSLENLQFILYYRQYRRRFLALPQREQAKSPAPPAASGDSQLSKDSGRSRFARILGGPLKAPSSPTSPKSATARLTREGTVDSTQGESAQDGGLPFADEISKVYSTFIAPGASKELNITSEQYAYATETLGINEAGYPTITTHPDALLEVYKAIYELVERDTLPKFIKQCVGWRKRD